MLYYFIAGLDYVLPCHCDLTVKLEEYKDWLWWPHVWSYNGLHCIPSTDMFCTKEEAEDEIRKRGYEVKQLDEKTQKLVEDWLK